MLRLLIVSCRRGRCRLIGQWQPTAGSIGSTVGIAIDVHMLRGVAVRRECPCQIPAHQTADHAAHDARTAAATATTVVVAVSVAVAVARDAIADGTAAESRTAQLHVVRVNYSFYDC